MDRRNMLQVMLSTGALGVLQQLSADEVLALGERIHHAVAPHGNTTAAQPAYAALTSSQARTVRVMAEEIIPRTDTPGATDANVTAFIDRMLAEWYSKDEREVVVRGLSELDRRAVERGGPTFVGLRATQRVAVLEALDGEVMALRKTNGTAANAHWFSTLKYLTVFGYCTSNVGMTQHLDTWPLPGRYDGNAPLRG